MTKDAKFLHADNKESDHNVNAQADLSLRFAKVRGYHTCQIN